MTKGRMRRGRHVEEMFIEERVRRRNLGEETGREMDMEILRQPDFDAAARKLLEEYGIDLFDQINDPRRRGAC